MFDLFPAGFDLNDVLFYSALLIAFGYVALWVGARRSRGAASEGGWLDLEATALDVDEDLGLTPSKANRVG